VAFTAVGAGVTAVLPHTVNLNGTAVVPDVLARDNTAFEIISATAAAITVRNNGTSAAGCNVWLWQQHTFERDFGGSGTTALVPRPFIIGGAASGSGGGMSADVFSYTVTGVEPDQSDLTITLPAARGDTDYVVLFSQGNAAGILGGRFPEAGRTTTDFRLLLTSDASAGDTLDFFVTQRS